MISLTRILTAAPVDRRIPALLFLYAAITLVNLHEYIQWTSVNLLLGFATLPFILETARGRPSIRYAFVSLLFGGLYLLLTIKTALFLAIGTALLFLFEHRRGRVSLTAFVTLVLMTPLTKAFADIYSFPIRLQLTKTAAAMISALGEQAQVSGNVITWKGVDFSVDPACMGMHMLISSLLCAILILVIRQKQSGRELGLPWIVVLLLGTLLLNAVANLIRIALLVLLHMMPETVGHDVIGMTTLIVYVITPLMAGIPLLLRVFGREAVDRSDVSAQVSFLPHYGLAVLILTGAVIARFANANPARPLPSVPGYTASFYEKDIVKLQSGHALVYVKDLKHYYGVEHSPLLCWTGKGWLFRQVGAKGSEVTRGTLVKGNDVLYTAWWYSHGNAEAAGSLSWRWESLRDGSVSYIVNVTASSEPDLQTEISRISSNQSLMNWMKGGTGK